MTSSMKQKRSVPAKVIYQHCPRVHPRHMHCTMSFYLPEAIQTHPHCPDEQREAVLAKIKISLDNTKKEQALWMRSQALLKWQPSFLDQPRTPEFMACVEAAAKHPLDSAGNFEPGFRDAIERARPALFSRMEALARKINQ